MTTIKLLAYLAMLDTVYIPHDAVYAGFNCPQAPDAVVFEQRPEDFPKGCDVVKMSDIYEQE